MRTLFDHNVPASLRRHLPNHRVTYADDIGLADVSNGRLIAAAERAGYDLLVTADQNIRFQQNLTGLRIGLVVLSTNIWRHIANHLPAIVAAIDSARPGTYVSIEVPRPKLLRRPSPSR